MALSKQYGGQEQAIFNKLFGSGASGGGTLSGMMDPKSLNTGTPTGAYQTAWNNSQNQIAQNYAQQKGSLAQSWANSGMGSNNTPSGFQADQQRKLGSSEADSRGSTYTGIVGQQHSDALNNFWNANNIAAGQQASATGGSTTGAGNSGSSSSAIYGTAGQYHPSQTGSVLGSALGAAGQVGAGAAMHCPRRGSMILMIDGSEKAVESLIVGDILAGADGKPCIVESAEPYVEMVLRVVTSDDCATDISPSHAMITPEGSFVIAFESIGRTVITKHGKGRVLGVTFVGRREVFDILTDGNHTYRANGIWAWGVRDVPSDSYLERPETYDKLLKMAV